MSREVAKTRRKGSRRPKKAAARNGSAGQKRAQEVVAAMAALDQLRAGNPRSAAVVSLLKRWLADESGYDEETWPKLKKAIDRQRDRVGARRLFDE